MFNFLNKKEEFSYKLDISILPKWPDLYKKLCKPESEKAWNEILDKVMLYEQRSDLVGDDYGLFGKNGLYGKSCVFTEYYDSASGLIMRFQGVHDDASGRTERSPVSQFGLRGWVFDDDNTWSREDLTNDVWRDHLAVEIGEGFIRNRIFDKNTGSVKDSDSDYEKSDYLFEFPLFDVVRFLFVLGRKFGRRTEGKLIRKWPDHITKQLKDDGVKYTIFSDDEMSNLIDIKSNAPDFFEEFGGPEVARTRGLGREFSSEVIRSYDVQLELFSPEDGNDRFYDEDVVAGIKS